MSISRRQFFRGLTGHSDDPHKEQQRRMAAVEAYVRTNLLPYDFALTAEQTAAILTGVVARMEINGKEDLLTPERRRQMSGIAEEIIERYREEYLRAEEVRREAMSFVEEFLSLEATPEELEKLQARFQIPYSPDLRSELERQIRAWLSSLPNARLAGLRNPTIRELVVSEIRSWC